jgi:hypothetical protein
MKYLGIIIDKKVMFREHITHATEKCRKTIFALSKSAKLNWGLSHKALKTLYMGDTATPPIQSTSLGRND